MGRFKNGINGPVVGKVGDVIGSSINGIPYVKGVYKKQTQPSAEGEAANQNKFSMAHYWLKPILSFVREGFKGYSQKSQGYNAAKSYLLLNSFDNSEPNVQIDPSRVSVSYGDLPLSENITVEQVEQSLLKFTWDPARVEGAHPDDQVMMLAYDVEHKDVWYKITGQFRKTGSDILDISKETGKTYQIYFAFTAANRSKQSNSVYLGEISM